MGENLQSSLKIDIYFFFVTRKEPLSSSLIGNQGDGERAFLFQIRSNTSLE